jgi:PadR family transcriptional regulator, regulatory protein PadR
MHRNPRLWQVMDTELLKGTLSLLILSLLSRKVMYGYEIAETVHSDTDGAFTWREGSLYPNLHKLELAGLIVGEWEEKESGRTRRYYHITKQGRAALAEMERLARGLAIHSRSGWSPSPTRAELWDSVQATRENLLDVENAIRNQDEGRLNTSLQELRNSYELVHDVLKRTPK